MAEEYEALIQFLYLAPVGIAQITIDGDVVMVNPICAQLLMPLSRDASLDNLFEVLSDVAPQLRGQVAGFADPSGVVCDALRIRLDAAALGTAESRVLSVSVFKLDESRLMVVLNDVSLDVRREERVLAEQLSDAARLDALTQLPNRTAVHEQLQRTLACARADAGHHFAVIFVNCDRFRLINDTLGHAAGNEVLACIAGRLRAALRPHDTIGRALAADSIAARVGGDEFVVLLDGLQRSDDVHVVARRLVDVLSQPYGIGEHQLHCSISMGIVLRAQASGDADAVLRDASIAMVEAKRAGGARYLVFEPAMQQRAARRGAMEADMRRALELDELFVVYQPVIGLAHSDCSAGLESLVRWRHPTRGLIPPVEFIGVAEDCGLIGALGAFVLSTACRQFAAWKAALGARAPRLLAVNLSRAQLAQPGLAAEIARTLRTCGMSPDQLQLEVTESLAAQDETIRARLHELKALGLTLALDDFGTGYSSLASLHQLPVDTIKIDRSFVSQADTSPHHRALIEATIHVAASLGMSTVAEGIETESQAAVVRRLGCDKGQGYLFAKPMEADDLMRWLSTAPMMLHRAVALTT